ncbi:hypothetical protein ACNTMW_08820 [Planosporangium sp. 12N6]|uniref:hypothetical protein n=1 Tax=Planosporangium spinosum TaxID=3402278 RepID=UPI003CF190C8
MTNGSEPRRRRWSSDSSRRAAEARRAAEEEDAENWLAGFRPVGEAEAEDLFSAGPPAATHAPAFGPPADAPPSPQAPSPQVPPSPEPPLPPLPEVTSQRRRRAERERPAGAVPERDRSSRRSRREDGPPSWPPVTPADLAGGGFRTDPEPPSHGFPPAREEPAPTPPGLAPRPGGQDRRSMPETPTGRRPVPETPTGRRPVPETPTGRRPVPEPDGRGTAPTGYGAAPYGSAPEQPAAPWGDTRHDRTGPRPAEPPDGRGRHTAPADPQPPTGARPGRAPVGGYPPAYPPAGGYQPADRTAGTYPTSDRPRPTSPGSDGPGTGYPASSGPGAGYPAGAETPAPGRRRVPEPVEELSGGHRPADFSARAAVSVPPAPARPVPPPAPARPVPPAAPARPVPPAAPSVPVPPPVTASTPVPPPPAPTARAAAAAPVRTMPQPLAPAAPERPEPTAPPSAPGGWRPPPVSVDPTEVPPARAAASARVAPTGTARVPVAPPRPPAAPSGGQQPDLDGLWSPPELPRRDGRRTGEDSGAIRRRAGEDSGALRRRGREPRRAEPEAGARAGADVPKGTARPSARRPGQTSPAAGDRNRLTMALIVGGVVVLVLVLVGGYLLVNDGPSSPASKTGAAGVATRDISTRDVDPAALTEPEVFPGPQVTVDGSPYQVLKTEATECPNAATDALVKLLGELDCTQVVRGTLKSPDGQYLMTAGIFNLKDETNANKAYEAIKPALDAQQGRFTGLAADGAEAIVRAPTTLGWHPLGHFLVYCIVARADGKPITADDAGSKEVIADIVEGHLRDNVLATRARRTPASAK